MAFLCLAVIPLHGQDRSTPPPNKPATVKWDSKKRHLKLLYDNKVVLDAVVRIIDKSGFPVESSKIEVEATEDISGEKLTQGIKFVTETTQEDVEFILEGKVFGSEEAFPAEESSGEQQRKFPYVRTCDGLSRNLRNNAIYDRYSDWLLSGPALGKTRIVPKKKDQGVEFLITCEGEDLSIAFKPRFYQKHKNLPYFEPWTYKVWKGSITGYCTWWAYREEGFDQEALDEVLDVWRRKNLVDFGYEYLQIDGGWATGTGSPEGYLTWNENFPGGSEYAVNKIKEAGMKPGLHTAIVFREGDPVNEKMVKEHPDWFMQKPDGSMLNDQGFYSLNTFNEEAVDRMIRPTYRGLKEQGWDYVKMDGAGDLKEWGYREYPEQFKKLNSTPSEALRRFYKAGREELGDDRFILACWSIKPELIGIVNGCRLGRDGFGPAELQYFNSWNGIVWRNDPDHCDIKPPWSTIDLPWFMEDVDQNPREINPDMIVRPSVVSMAGGMLLLSDKAEVYEDDKNLEGIKRSSPVLFTVPGQLYDYNTIESDRVLNNTEDNPERFPEPRINLRHPNMLHPPHRGNESPWWMMEIDRPFENWSVLARFNWRKRSLHWNRDNVAAEEVRFSDLGLPEDKEYLVYEFWSKRFLGKSKYSFIAPFQASDNGLQVFSIREVRAHPWVVSTSRHISQGGVDLINLRWDEDRLDLVGESAVVKLDPYIITVYIPGTYDFLELEPSGLNAEITKYDEYFTVTITPGETKTINWRMTFAK